MHTCRLVTRLVSCLIDLTALLGKKKKDAWGYKTTNQSTWSKNPDIILVFLPSPLSPLPLSLLPLGDVDTTQSILGDCLMQNEGLVSNVFNIIVAS